MEVDLNELAKQLSDKDIEVKQYESKYMEFKIRCHELEDSFKSSENNLSGLIRVREHLNREHCIVSYFRIFTTNIYRKYIL